ncbi:hypothetical protein T484DRAFT_2748642 [Baffinella frigidus]|nr:hypothetical protein T484DRAFT_2748642 [Cryptophyta sp. CCMP2293]
MLDRHTIWVAGSILVPAGMALVIGVDKFIPGSIGPIFGGSDELLAGQEEKLRAVTHQVAAVRQSLQGIVAYHEGAVTMAQIGKIWVHAALMGGFLVYQQYQKDECVALRERVAWYAHRIAAISAPSTPRWGGEKKQEKKPTPFGGKLTPPLELSRRSNDSPRSTQSPRQAAAQGGETGWGDAFEGSVLIKRRKIASFVA